MVLESENITINHMRTALKVVPTRKDRDMDEGGRGRRGNWAASDE